MRIADAIIRAPWAILAAAVILTAASAWYSITRLELHTDQDDLVSEKLAYHKRYKDYLREFGDLEYLYIVIEASNDLPRAKEFAKAVSERLSGVQGIKEVAYKISNPALERSFLLFLTKPELSGLSSFLGSGPTSAKSIAAWKNLASVLQTMNRMMERPQPEARQEEMRSGFYFLNEMLAGIQSTLKTGAVYQPMLSGAFLGGSRSFDEEGYLLTPNGKLLFVMIMPEKRYDTLSVIEEPLKRIREVVAATKKDFPDVTAGLTGRPVLQADEMSTTNRDMTLATVLAIFAVTILFVAYFRRLARPLMAVATLVFGICWTFGLTTLVIGYLNLLSTVFAVTLVGAGIEFGLQIVSRYREEIDAHRDAREAVRAVVTKTSIGNMTAAATTAAAFYAALFTEFRALRELGFIAGTGILLCLAAIVIILPTMMYLGDRRKEKAGLKSPLFINLRGIEHLYRRPAILLGLLAVVTVALLPGIFRIRFDHNLLNLQAEGIESVKYEKLIIEKSEESTWYAIVITSTAEEAKKIAEEMRKRDSVGKVETFETIVPPEQDEKMKIISALRQSFEGIEHASIDPSVDRKALLYNLDLMQKNIGHLTELAFSSGHFEAAGELDSLAGTIDAIHKEVLDASETRMRALARFQKLFLGKVREGLDILKSGLDPAHIGLSDAPANIRARYVSPMGNFATYIYPKYNIWEPDRMNEFVAEIRSISPTVSGTPIEVFESSRLMQESFRKAAIYAFFTIFILVIIDFKKLRYALLAIAPLVAGMVWLLEAMGWTGIPFNLANFFAIPIILGVGVDNGVQIVHRYLQEGKDVRIMSKSTGAAVLLTSLTTGISFGTMILSRHRGIQSLGLIMALGAITCLIGSIVLLPALLKMVATRSSSPRRHILPSSGMPGRESR